MSTNLLILSGEPIINLINVQSKSMKVILKNIKYIYFYFKYHIF